MSGVIAAFIATATSSCHLALSTKSRQNKFASMVGEGWVRVDRLCNVAMIVAVLALFGSFSAFGYSKIVPNMRACATSATLGLLLMIAYLVASMRGVSYARSHPIEGQATEVESIKVTASGLHEVVEEVVTEAVDDEDLDIMLEASHAQVA